MTCLEVKTEVKDFYLYFHDILKVTKPEDITAESLALFTIMEPPIGMPFWWLLQVNHIFLPSNAINVSFLSVDS